MYTIQAGDTLYSISQRYGVPVSVLMQVNDIKNPYALRIDQEICIPGNGVMKNGATQNGSVCSGLLHTIAPGDTPYMLAKQYEVSLESILQANPDMDPHNLRIGGQICIPGISQAPPAAPEPAPMPMPTPTPAPVIPAPIPVIPRPSPPPMPAPTPPPAPVIPAPIPVIPRPSPPPMPAPTPTPMPTPMPMPTIPPIIQTPFHEMPAPQPAPTPAPQPAPTPTPAPAPFTPAAPPPSILPVREGAACTGKFYTVVEGDTLYMIAKRNEISLDALMEANPALDLYNLEVGMRLCIPSMEKSPCPAPCPSPRRESPVREDCYFVRMGDNMDKICDHFRVLPRNLMKANPNLTVIDYSIPGTRICIPSN